MHLCRPAQVVVTLQTSKLHFACQLWAAFEKSRVPQLLILAVSGAWSRHLRSSRSAAASMLAMEVRQNAGLLQPHFLLAHLVRTGQPSRSLGTEEGRPHNSAAKSSLPGYTNDAYAFWILGIPVSQQTPSVSIGVAKECLGCLPGGAPLGLPWKCSRTSALLTVIFFGTWKAHQDRPGVELMFAPRAMWGCWALYFHCRFWRSCSSPSLLDQWCRDSSGFNGIARLGCRELKERLHLIGSAPLMDPSVSISPYSHGSRRVRTNSSS